MTLLLLLTSFSTALAASSVPLELGRKEALDRAGVSVVRLLVSYTASGAKVPDVQCTGLGVLVASWSDATGDAVQNNWVLADGNLINPNNSATCLPPNTKKLTPVVQIFYSNAYSAGVAPISSDAIPLDANTVRCEKPTCKDGLALLAFHNDEAQPFVDLITNEKQQGDGLALTNLGGQISLSPVNTKSALADAYKAGITQLLTPNLVSHEQVNESWLPLLNTHGQLVGVQSTSGNGNTFTPSTTIQGFLANIGELKAPPANPLHDSWNRGIDNYYNERFANAQQDFQTASKLNAQFLAAKKMEELAATAKPPIGASPTKNNNQSQPTGNFLAGWNILWPWLLVAAIVAAVLFLAMRRMMRQAALEKELKEIERPSAIAAEEIRRQEAQQRQEMLKPPATPASTTANYQPQTDAYCPRCSGLVARNAKYCPTCHMPLPASGPKVQPQTLQPEAAHLQPGVTRPLPWRGKKTGGLTTEQLTTTTGGLLNGATLSSSLPPYSMSQSTAPRLGFTIATRSDPGIKRKYKPNEDSLVAARGTWTVNKAQVPLGLFVVADGMGGHANGQDASRRAIQTIVDYMVPKIVKSKEMPTEALPHLLVEAVQHANQAVHQNNVELRADMGTTVTAAMVVGSTAYVANVGDSRTYLYREGKGLRRITNDHSVVASLVEAGIIKPDDIYTHPKRNQIYRSLGEKPLVEVDPFMEELQMGDKLLLCSDGLWDMVRDPKIEEVIKRPMPDPAMTADALVQAALDGGGEDNVSVIVVSMIEGSEQTLISGIQLLDKPDSLQMPQV